MTKAIFPNKPHGLHTYEGSAILTRDEHDRLYVWDTGNPQRGYELRNSEIQVRDRSISGHDLTILPVQFERPLEAVIQDQFAIIIRPTTLEIYGLPSTPPPDSIVSPIAVHRWQWKLDSVVVSAQASWGATKTGTLSPINVLIRYGSLLPWVRRRPTCSPT